MSVKEAKEKTKAMMNNRYKTVISYMNNYGEFKSCYILEYLGDMAFYETEEEYLANAESLRHKNTHEGDLKDDDKLNTGACLAAIYYVQLSGLDFPNAFPGDLELDTESYDLRFDVPYYDFIACTGDITKTGEIDVTDLSTMQEYLADNMDLDEIQQIAADINDDSEVNTADLLEIQEYIVKN